MMRSLMALGVALLLTGCGVACDASSELDGRYAVFANVVAFEGTNLDAFPSYMSPSNGWSDWDLAWPEGADTVAVAIDDQSYVADASSDPRFCGTFSMSLSGTYTSVNVTSHVFAATGDFVVFGPQLEGDWVWDESWVALDGETGTFSATGQLSGLRID